MLPNASGNLIQAAYPECSDSRRAVEIAAEFEGLRELVRMARTLRSEFQISPETKMKLAIRPEQGFTGAEFIRRNAGLIGLLVNGPVPDFVETRPEGSVVLAGRGYEAYAMVKESVDVAKLVEKLEKELEKDRSIRHLAGGAQDLQPAPERAGGLHQCPRLFRDRQPRFLRRCEYRPVVCSSAEPRRRKPSPGFRLPLYG